MVLETPHIQLCFIIAIKLRQMGLEDNFCLTGAATWHGRKSSKGGDSSFFPIPRSASNGWPKIVIVAGFAKNLGLLRHDVRWFISNSGGETKIVLIISIQQNSKTFVIEKWCPQLNLLRRSPRRSPPLGITQTITISHRAGSAIDSPGSYHVEGAPLNFEFDKVLSRAPASQGETDISLGLEALQRFASGIWRAAL